MSQVMNKAVHTRLENPVLIMAGGTGGHIFPGLAVAGELRQRDVDVLWLGSSHGMENTLVPKHGYPLESIAIAGLRGRGLKNLLLTPFRLLRAVVQALAVLRRHQPRSVLSMGGFAAGPGGIAAWLTRRPLVVHEQNSIPGLTNRVLAKLARRVLVGFPGAFSGRAEDAGNPVRADIHQLPDPAQRLGQRLDHSVDQRIDQAPTVNSKAINLLVLGGSQGAGSLNVTVPAALAQVSQAVCVRHQCGERHRQATTDAYAGYAIDVQVEPFIDDMACAYGWADLVICRAGALTVAELTAAGVGSLLVPFPFAVDDHQTHNAQHLVSHGAARLCPEDTLDAASLAALVNELLGAPEQLKAMAVNARQLARPEAAARVAEACLEVVS